MASRISPWMWPLLALASPVLVPEFLWRNRTFKANREWAEAANRQRIDGAPALALPALDFLDLTILVDEKTRPGFRGDPGVSYLITTNRGTVLFDVGFGPDSPTLAHNSGKLGVDPGKVAAVAISHLHPDHMGGMAAFRSRAVRIPPELSALKGKPCYLPDEVDAADLEGHVVKGPKMLAAGIGTTGPLARSLFFLGRCEEQALVARLQDKGLVVITGCGHPTVDVILGMVGHLSNDPLHAIVGGLHFPVTKSRLQRWGIQLQMFLGTGKPPWQRITEDDLSLTIAHINRAGPKRVLLSAHDTCDHALDRLAGELRAETAVLEAGQTYQL
jgi:7,8-dihydropterin-6-yl-methyl-4-(beta-D-ribofuranosyl)aminobenzene 5'-phosphate synthase